MSRHRFAALALIMVLTGAAQAQETARPEPTLFRLRNTQGTPFLATPFLAVRTSPLPEPTLFRLRNTAAADVAKAITQYAAPKKLTLSIVAEPLSNTVLVAGDPAAVKQVSAIIEKLDTPPQQFVIEVTILEATPAFVEHVGLVEKENSKKESLWVLTEREYRMLKTAGFRDAKARGELSILSRPQLTTCDNQTGYVQIGNVDVSSNDSPSIAARITPRNNPDGILMDMRFKVESQSGSCEMKAAASGIPDGGAVVVRGQEAGENSEYLYIMKVKKVAK